MKIKYPKKIFLDGGVAQGKRTTPTAGMGNYAIELREWIQNAIDKGWISLANATTINIPDTINNFSLTTLTPANTVLTSADNGITSTVIGIPGALIGKTLKNIKASWDGGTSTGNVTWTLYDSNTSPWLVDTVVGLNTTDFKSNSGTVTVAQNGYYIALTGITGNLYNFTLSFEIV